jgi:thyrotropin-releasing hormone receptor
MKVRSTSYYLRALSVADTGFLATLLLVWLNNIIGVQVFNKEGSCQALVYISSICNFFSVWLTVAFTVDRFIAVQYTEHGQRMCTVARTKAIVNYLAVVTLFLQVYSFVTAGKVKQHDGSELCDMLEEGGEIMINISIIYILVTQIIPLILIVIMNAMIVRKLLELRKLAGTNQETATPEEEMRMARLDINFNQINVSSHIPMNHCDNICLLIFFFLNIT